MTENLEKELEQLLFHSIEIGKILKRNCKSGFPSIEIHIGGFHSDIGSTTGLVVSIWKDTMRDIILNTRTETKSLAEINYNIQKKMNLIPGHSHYNEYYYEE
jgi:hypothetical protein